MKELLIIGWREWVSLPELGIKEIKAKIDTGARSSCLHAEDIEIITHKKKEFVHFTIDPFQNTKKKEVRVKAPFLEYRNIRSSNGKVERRPVIVTDIELMGNVWPIEVTLTSRDVMGFRMLLGRQAIKKKFLIDAHRSFLAHER
ncbi:MAG: ATP-dependent zinc protease [Deltaproteobacteria bacterium CG_4_10_14_0_2_um_filter_43_8]|nr:MAG: ATP-dependent zinc protease [Deltaproteobacteria bacterium CG11_big_fil_rev_8_21_14_0_20_42_23]PJA18847.1 MAG: ATP-dependent zinc protease [Deltaproteobacteria bacterium CG_4_10_14_0_2_um_filter_43_8]PJC64774.1 MAG: ATP-dependent zinc protease [Deltaproteobacteria bacterium CG_4_9_14_0_2_um_filter_42_21]